VPLSTVSQIRALDIGPEVHTDFINPKENALEDKPSGAVVAGSLVAFAPGVTALHQQDVLQSVLLAQLAANAKAQRHSDPVAWFGAYRSVMEQTAWVVDASSASTRYLPEVVKFSAATVVNDVFRRQVAPEELAYVTAVVNGYKSDVGGASQLVFECPSHSGGIGNFQVALAAEEGGVLSMRIAQVSFNAPQHVLQLMLEEFTSTAQFQVAFLALTQNEEVYSKIRSSIAGKLETRFRGSVVLLQIH
jgi:hypothetical protein